MSPSPSRSAASRMVAASDGFFWPGALSLSLVHHGGWRVDLFPDGFELQKRLSRRLFDTFAPVRRWTSQVLSGFPVLLRAPRCT
jgi:hypothetical protein